jgi:hypothetical protein
LSVASPQGGELMYAEERESCAGSLSFCAGIGTATCEESGIVDLCHLL